MTKDEALTMAIDALENTDRSKLFELERNAIAAIREALAQPELCKYGNEVQGCTSSPMNCQCCFDALGDLDEEPIMTREVLQLAHCLRCNAPHQPPVAVMLRCGPCAVINGKLPPTKFKQTALKGANHDPRNIEDGA
jgi:hypothetical protein